MKSLEGMLESLRVNSGGGGLKAGGKENEIKIKMLKVAEDKNNQVTQVLK